MNTQKKIAVSLAVVAGVGVAVAGGLAPRSVSAQSAKGRTHIGTPLPGEVHPKVRAALNELTLAESNLSQATHDIHDFGGHRMRAEQLTAQAIIEARKALTYHGH